jgi:hypothetical protein
MQINTFLQLVEYHFENDLLFDLNKHIEKIDDDTCNNLEWLKISDVLPTTVLITEDNDFNVCYHGRECDVRSKQLYRYQDYFIIYEYCGYGDDTDVFSINHNYGESLVNFYGQCFSVHTKDEFDYMIFLAGNKNLKFLMNFFKNVHPETGLVRLQKYIESIY